MGTVYEHGLTFYVEPLWETRQKEQRQQANLEVDKQTGERAYHETNWNHLQADGWRMTGWVSYGGLRMINAQGKRSEPHSIESGAPSGRTSCPNTLALDDS